MSAILSADDLNDFISPGVACIKPVESIPQKSTKDTEVGDMHSPYWIFMDPHLLTMNDRILTK